VAKMSTMMRTSHHNIANVFASKLHQIQLTIRNQTF
jgi:hypothetical protein